jgi:secretion/DNA translocation related CpaE-like protein
VLVGADLADALINARAPARPGVVLVARGGPTGGLEEVAALAGAEEMIGLPAGEAVLLDRLADTAEPSARARLIGVVAGRGGAGASVLAAALALSAAASGPAWLVDLDPLGGGADVGMGAELSAGARWTDLGVLSGRLSHSALRAALPQVDGVAVVAAGPGATDPTAEAVRAVLAAAGRGAGTVVLDLPRHRTAARDVAVAAVDDLLVVVPAELRAVLAARQVVYWLGPARPAPRAVVRRVPDGLPTREVVRGVELAAAGELADEPEVRTALLTGTAADLLRGDALAALCADLLGSPAPLRVAA